MKRPPMDPNVPAFQRLRAKIMQRVSAVDAESDAAEKVAAIQDIVGWCWAIGVSNLPAAVDIWHEVAEKLALPPSTIDREIARYQQRLQREECSWFAECEDPDIPADKFDLLHCYTQDDPWWHKLDARCRQRES